MYKIPEKILILENQEERLLLNCEDVYPVYFPKGGEFICDLLQELKSLEPFSELPVDQNADELLDFFLKNKLIVPFIENKPEKENLKKDCSCGNAPTRLSHSRSVYVLLTQSCNQSCIYCLNGKETYQKKENLKMPEEIAKESIERTLESILPDGNLEVVFFGGEPLMNWSLAKSIIHFCENELKQKHPNKIIRYHLTTNLTIFPSDLIEYSLKYEITYLVNVDGPEEIHNKTRPFLSNKGTFKITKRNIQRLIDAGLDVAMRATITSFNHDNMLDIAKVHKELGGSSTAYVPLNPVDSDINILPFDLCPDPKKFSKGLLEVYHSGLWDKDKIFPFTEFKSHLTPGFSNRYGCGAPHGNTPVVTTEGKIYSCIYLVGNEKYEIGDIKKNDFPRTEVLQRMMDIVDMENREKCIKCAYKNLCGGGCPVGLFSIADNPDTPDEVRRYESEMTCTITKTTINTLLWELAYSQKEKLELSQKNGEKV